MTSHASVILAKPRRLSLSSDPGALYNMGNILCLAAGVAASAIGVLNGVEQASYAQAAAIFLVGTPGAILITLSTIVFFLGGTAYSQAWSNGAPPDERHLRRGDLLSGSGALLFGGGMLLVGDPVLAATAGALHAFGKFGSAWMASPSKRDLFKRLVLISRFPAIASGLFGLVGATLACQGAEILLSTSAVLSCVLWMMADYKLLKS